MEKLPFIPNHVYNRKQDIHGVYGGNPQSGISNSSKHPYIFIFSSKSGHQHGYKDAWDNTFVFSYTGEGQVGDMEFTRGNLALRDHKQNGKRVFLFESDGRGRAKFVCEVELISYNRQDIWDRTSKQRSGITFFFKQVGVYLPIEVDSVFQSSLILEPSDIYGYVQPNETERRGLVTSRVGQGAYRQRILLRWNAKCAVTGFDKEDILIASHIVPWAESTNIDRIDPNNGILLSPTYDALFDHHLISFENSGKIILAETIEYEAYQKIGVTGLEKIKDFREGNFDFLEKHRLRFNENY